MFCLIDDTEMSKASSKGSECSQQPRVYKLGT